MLAVGCTKAPQDTSAASSALVIKEADLGNADFRGAALKPDTTDAPLRHWMQQRFGGPWPATRITQYAPALRALGVSAPADMPNWSSIAEDGAKAADIGDEQAVRAACRMCHQSYQTLYAQTRRAQALPAGL